MGYLSGAVSSIGTAPQPVAANNSGQYGIVVSNLGTIALFIGGPNVVSGSGIQIPVTATPFLVPSHQEVGDGQEDLYVVVSGAGTNGILGWMAVVD